MGHPVLRAKARPIDPGQIGSPQVQQLIDDLFETMHEYQGVGLAAPQVGWGGRVLVLNPSGQRKDEAQALTVVNPRILKRWGKQRAEEGCLSFPDIFVEVDRAAGVRLAWQDTTGAAHEEDFTEFPARILQHEIDHLDGVLLVHRMSPVDKIRWRRELDELLAAQPVANAKVSG